MRKRVASTGLSFDGLLHMDEKQVHITPLHMALKPAAESVLFYYIVCISIIVGLVSRKDCCIITCCVLYFFTVLIIIYKLTSRIYAVQQAIMNSVNLNAERDDPALVPDVFQLREAGKTILEAHSLTPVPLFSRFSSLSRNFSL
jgi:hypothetical protein